MSLNQRRQRIRLLAALAPVSGMALGAMALGVTPATQPGVILPLASEDGQAAAQALDTNSSTVAPTTAVEPVPSTTTTTSTTVAPTPVTTIAVPPADPESASTTAPETSSPASPTATPPPATSDAQQPAPTTVGPAQPGPTKVSQPPSATVVTTPPGSKGDSAAPSTTVAKPAPNTKPANPADDGDVLSDPPPGTLRPSTPPVVGTPGAGIPDSADPGPALAAPPLGAVVPAPADSAAGSTVAVVAAGAAQRLTELTAAQDRLASIVDQITALDEEIATSAGHRSALVAAALPATRAELQAGRLEASVVADAAALGHDVARHDLAVAVSADAGSIDPEALDGVWQRTDARRLGVMYTALRQVGDPYVFATAGPAQFDCSGLTLYAWQTVGVHLAHYSFTQRSEVPEANPTQLQPGDLIFNLRSTGGHVMLSLGFEHLMVHAPAPGLHVTVSRWRKATGFGAPLGAAPIPRSIATPSPTLPTTPPLPTRPAPLTKSAVSTPTVSAASVLPSTATASEIADEAGRRYGMDPAVLVARATLRPDDAPAVGNGLGATTLRPDLVAALGVDPADPRSVADATTRYLVAATTDLGDVATALAALEIGAGPASASTWPEAVKTQIDGVLARADELSHPTGPPTPPKGLERALVWLSSGWAIRHNLP